MDHLTKQQRSELMRRIKGSNTLPEKILSRELTKLGIEHRRNAEDLPGTPDIAIDLARVAVFVDGCFWHGCPLHYQEPDTRRMFWRAKMQRTKKRDRRVRCALLMVGWKVVAIWEHEIKKNPRQAAARAATAAGGKLFRGSGKTVNRFKRLNVL